MSSEYSIHLGNRHIAGRVESLSPELSSTVVRLTVGDMSLGTGDPSTRAGFILYVKNDRLLEASLLFHKIAQDLAALIPDVELCREQCEADAEAERQQEPTDTIPIDEAAEHVDTPHRYG